MRKATLLVTLAITAFALSMGASAVLCKYIDADGNLRYTNEQPDPTWKPLSCGVGEEIPAKPTPKKNESRNAGKLIYPDNISATFEREDEPSGKNGFKKCEVSIVLNANLTAEFVDFRAKVLTNGKQTIPTITVDVVEFTISNGIPYDPKKKPISSAKVVSNIFDTTSKPQVDMGDGGRGVTLDVSSFASVIKLIARGDYIVAFRRNDSSDETLYAVRQGVDKQVLGQYLNCVQRM